MNFIEDIPLYLRTIYRFCGIIQFTYEDSSSRCSQIFSRLWPIPLFLFFCYSCVLWFRHLIVVINLLNLNILQVEVMMTIWAAFTEITCMVVFTLRSQKLKMLLLKLDEFRNKFPFVENNKPERDWLEILVLVITFLNFSVNPLQV